MKKIFFTCGPSQLYPTVEKHIQKALNNNIPSLSHRSVKFQEIYKSTQDKLRKFLRIPKGHHIFFLASSLESMERIIENCVDKHSFHFVNGAFSRKFYQFAKMLKKDLLKYEAADGKGFDVNKIKIPKNSELICVTHNETSTGVSIPLQYINKLKSDSSRLIAVDIVSSVPYVKIDFSKVDITFFSVQKGFGLPAGMGVLLVNERAINKANFLAKKGNNIGSYHSFLSFLDKDKIFQTPETPNVLSIYLLGKVLDDMLEKGIDTIRKEIEEKAKLVYGFFDNHSRYIPFVIDKNFRSKTTIVIDVKGKAKEIVKKLTKIGFIVSSGYGQFKASHIRIANFPAHTIGNCKRLLSNFFPFSNYGD